MRYHASLTAAFLLLAGCAGNGGYTKLPGEVAAPSAGGRGLAQADPYAQPEAGPDGGYGQPDPGYAQPRQPARQAQYSVPEPSYSGPGALYDRQASYQPPQQQSYSAPQSAPQDDPTAGMDGPRGSSSTEDQRYDEVGYAGVRGVAGGDANGGAVVAISKSVPAGSFLEVTNLETGRTIIVLVTGQLDAGADHPLDLSPGAVSQLGASGSMVPVRVRKVTASPQDQAALRAGQAAGQRPDTPPVLLNALRKHLPGGGAPSQQAYAPRPSYTPPARQPAATRQPTRPAQVATGGRYYVQVGAFGNTANAQSLAKSLGGFVKPGGGLNRVQMGPYRTSGEAEAARANAARHGYGDARIFTQ